MKQLIVCCALLAGFSGIVYCAQASRVELSDGSVINAEVVSLDNGIYTLNVESLGRITIDASKIRTIETPVPETHVAPTGDIPVQNSNAVSSKTEQLERIVEADPEIMKKISGLLTDQQFKDLLEDPEIVNAAESKDINALLLNKKFKDVLNHPAIKEIADKMDLDSKTAR